MNENTFSYPQTYLNWQKRHFFDLSSAEYLWVPEAEWCSANWQLPTYGEHIAGLVPFAFSGAGDGWCFYDEGEILFCLHDEDEAVVYAPHFLAWFYRRCLEFLAIVSDEDEADEARKLLARGASLLEEGGARAFADTLHGLTPGSLAEEQVLPIVHREFGERYVDGKIKWQWSTTACAHARGTDESAEAEASERFQKELLHDRYAQATIKADEVFRAKNYDQYVALLSPFSDMLTSVQQKKLKLANKKAVPKERD